jgi:hypothetical protein
LSHGSDLLNSAILVLLNSASSVAIASPSAPKHFPRLNLAQAHMLVGSQIFSNVA